MTQHCIWTAGLLTAAVSSLGIASAHGAETKGAPAWTATQRKRGYVAFQHHTLHLLESSDVPAAEAAARTTVTCSLARGEYDSVQIGIHTLGQDIKHVRLAVQSDVAVRVFRRIDGKDHKLLDGYVNPVPNEIRGAFLDESDEIASVADCPSMVWPRRQPCQAPGTLADGPI